MQLYFMRHGQTEWNAAGRMQGQTDIPLSAVGLEQARAAAARLQEVSFAACLSSPLIRAKRTAEIVLGGRTLTIEEDPLLKEIAFGVHEGQRFAELESNPQLPLHQFFFAPQDYVPGEGAESIYDLLLRNLKFLNKMMSRSYGPQDKILITTHGAFIRGLVNLAANLAVSQFWRRHPLPNCGLMIMEVDAKSYRLVSEGVDLLKGELPPQQA